MRYVNGVVLAGGETCYGQVTTTPPEKRENTNLIFLTKELEMGDYTKVLASQAVICEQGGKTGHMTVICRILGIPVFLIKNATQIFTENEELTLDAITGRVYFGKRYIPKPIYSRANNELSAVIQNRPIHFQLSIVNEQNIDWINSLDHTYVDEFFLREEFIWVRENISPFAFFKRFGSSKTTELLISNLGACLTKMKSGQWLNYRSLDIRSDDFRHFREGHAQVEINPQLGLHGIRQLLIEEDFLVAELQAIDDLYGQGYSNITFSLPFVNDQDELRQVKQLIHKHCSHDIRLGIFVETPAAVSELSFMIDEGVTSVYIGTKDLTQLVLGCDRGNARVAHIYDTRKRSVVSYIDQVLNTCLAHNMPVSLFTLYEDLLFFLKHSVHLKHISLCCAEYQRIANNRDINQSYQLAA